ncbi:MAG: PASTA domain-containing protein [Pyrinomonadaceae bacterium]
MTAKRTVVLALGKVGLILVVAAAFTLAMLGTIYLSLRSPEVQVPEVVNKKRWDAEDALNESGLNMRVRATRYVAKVQPDMVLSQSPAPGQAVKAGQTIAVVVSRARGKDDPIAVPDAPAEGDQAATAQNQNAAVKNQNSNERPARPRNANAKNTNAVTAGALNANVNRDANANKGLVTNRNSNTKPGGVSPNNSNRAPRNANVNRPTPAAPRLTNWP